MRRQCVPRRLRTPCSVRRECELTLRSLSPRPCKPCSCSPCGLGSRNLVLPSGARSGYAYALAGRAIALATRSKAITHLARRANCELTIERVGGCIRDYVCGGNLYFCSSTFCRSPKATCTPCMVFAIACEAPCAPLSMAIGTALTTGRDRVCSDERVVGAPAKSDASKTSIGMAKIVCAAEVKWSVKPEYACASASRISSGCCAYLLTLPERDMRSTMTLSLRL